jgi:hypothetical protein
MKLGELISSWVEFDRAVFVREYPEPVLIFVKGLDDQAPDEVLADDDTTEFGTTTRFRIRPGADSADEREALQAMGSDAVVVFLKKRSPWTPFADVLTVGRATIQDVCIPLLSVSKFHVCLTRDPNGWKLTDQRAANGTFVDGRKLDPGGSAALQNGSRVDFGPEAKAVFLTPEGLSELVASRRAS